MKLHEFRLSFVFSFSLLSHLTPNILAHRSTNDSRVAISFKEFYTFLRAQSQDIFDVHMGLMYLTASDGDEFYNFEQSVSRNCLRVAQATMKIYLNFSTSNEISNIKDKAMADVYETVKTTKELKHPLEFFCNETEKLVLQHPTLASIYLQLKNSVNISETPRKRYFNTIFDRNLVQNYTKFFSIPGFIKATMQEEFTNQANESEAYNTHYNVLARAIIEVSRKGKYREKIEKIQENVLSEIKSLIEKSGNIFENFTDDDKTLKFTLTMMDKYEKYFNDDPNLHRELTLAKTAIESKN